MDRGIGDLTDRGLKLKIGCDTIETSKRIRILSTFHKHITPGQELSLPGVSAPIETAAHSEGIG